MLWDNVDDHGTSAADYPGDEYWDYGDTELFDEFEMYEYWRPCNWGWSGYGGYKSVESIFGNGRAKGHKVEASNLKKREENRTKAELQALYAACRRAGLNAEQIVKAAPCNPREDFLDRRLVSHCCREMGYSRQEVAKVLGMEWKNLPPLENAHVFIEYFGDGDHIDEYVRRMRRNIEGA